MREVLLRTAIPLVAPMAAAVTGAHPEVADCVFDVRFQPVAGLSNRAAEVAGRSPRTGKPGCTLPDDLSQEQGDDQEAHGGGPRRVSGRPVRGRSPLSPYDPARSSVPLGGTGRQSAPGATGRGSGTLKRPFGFCVAALIRPAVRRSRASRTNHGCPEPSRLSRWRTSGGLIVRPCWRGRTALRPDA